MLMSSLTKCYYNLFVKSKRSGVTYAEDEEAEVNESWFQQ